MQHEHAHDHKEEKKEVRASEAEDLIVNEMKRHSRSSSCSTLTSTRYGDRPSLNLFTRSSSSRLHHSTDTRTRRRRRRRSPNGRSARWRAGRMPTRPPLVGRGTQRVPPQLPSNVTIENSGTNLREVNVILVQKGMMMDAIHCCS